MMRHGIVFGFGILTLVLVNVSAWQREQIVAGGERLLLRLGPVDPRSLMQGDYMRLSYDQGPKIYDVVKEQARTGTVIVKRDQNDIATGFILDHGGPLESGQIRLFYRSLHPDYDPMQGDDPVWIAPTSFMFQEGMAEVYDKARFAELMVDEKGRAVLIGLINFERERLGASPFLE